MKLNIKWNSGYFKAKKSDLLKNIEWLSLIF